MKYDWILFDLDNTLMDFHEASKLSFYDLMKSHGILHGPELYPIYQQVNFLVWKDFEAGKIDAVTLRAKRFQDFYLKTKIKGMDPMESNATYLQNLIRFSTMLEGSIELLDFLKGKVKMAIITNGLREVQRPRLDALNITSYFDAIVVSDEIGWAKPQKEYFDYAMNECNQPRKEHTLVVGDSLHSDIKGGLEYGLPTCWCNLFGQEPPKDILPDQEINALHELKEIIL